MSDYSKQLFAAFEEKFKALFHRTLSKGDYEVIDDPILDFPDPDSVYSFPLSGTVRGTNENPEYHFDILNGYVEMVVGNLKSAHQKELGNPLRIHKLWPLSSKMVEHVDCIDPVPVR